MPKKKITQREADRRIRSLVLQVKLLKLTYSEILSGDPASINALLGCLGKLISIKWQKGFFAINTVEDRLAFVQSSMLDCLRNLVCFVENLSDNRYALGDVYRSGLLEIMQNLESCGVNGNQINEIIHIKK